MNKNISINISGIIFHIDEDGFERLKSYLESISAYFSTFDDNKEIVADIESRIAEIFLEKLHKGGNQVISLDDVNALMATMGTVADFKAAEAQDNMAAEEAGTPTPPNTNTNTGTTEAPTGGQKPHAGPKVLYRDLNRKTVGGVASGIAHYFGIDPIWIRLLWLFLLFNFFSFVISCAVVFTYFILYLTIPGSGTLEDDKKVKKMFRNQDSKVLGGVAAGVAAYFGIEVAVARLLFVVGTLLGGAGLFIYILMWLITPPAITLTEKMQMQGEPVTLSNIETNIKAGPYIKENEENLLVKIFLFPFRVIGLIINGFINILGPAGSGLIAIFRVFIGLIFTVTGLLLMIFIALASSALLGLLIGVWDVNIVGVPLDIFNRSLSWWTTAGIFLVCFLPALGITLAGISIILKKWTGTSYFGWILLGLWLISLLIVGYTVPQIIMEYSYSGSYTETKTWSLPGKTAVLTLEDRHRWRDRDIDLDLSMVRTKLRGHSDSLFRADFNFEAWGANRATAEENAQMVTYNLLLIDSVFSFPEELTFEDDARFMGQNLTIVLYIPYNQPFVIDRTLCEILKDTLHRNGYSTWQTEGNTWIFTEDGLKCTTCMEPSDATEY